MVILGDIDVNERVSFDSYVGVLEIYFYQVAKMHSRLENWGTISETTSLI